MDPGSLVLAALILLPALGLLVWTCAAIAQVDEEMRKVCGFQLMSFDIASHGGARGPWPGRALRDPLPEAGRGR